MWSSVSNNALSHQNYLDRLQVHLLHPILLSPRAEERWPYRYLAQQRSGSDVMDERLQQPDKLWPCLIPKLITSFLTVFSIEYGQARKVYLMLLGMGWVKAVRLIRHFIRNVMESRIFIDSLLKPTQMISPSEEYVAEVIAASDSSGTHCIAFYWL